MAGERTIWLVYNAASGSNSEAALAALEQAFAEADCVISGRTCFPDDDLPTIAQLRQSAPDMLAVFAGDGTVSSVVTGLYGWEGQVLVLPGGTMNLLSHRLHGDARPGEVIARCCAGRVQRVRPAVIRTRHGDALTGVLAGPGTAWNEVREAMREADVAAMISSASEAVAVSTDGPMVSCIAPGCGRDEGYPAINLTPGPDGIRCEGYFVDTLGDYARQAMALLQRDFRDGPHEHICTGDRISLACGDSETIDLLIDGEPQEGGVRENFQLAECGIDLVATDYAG